MPAKKLPGKRRIAKMEGALKVIYTWATFQDGSLLEPKPVARLIEKALGMAKGKAAK